MCRALNILFLHVPLYVIDPYKLPEIRLAYRLLLIVACQDWLMFVYRLHRLKKTPARLVLCLTSQRILCKVFICRHCQPFTQSDLLFTPLSTSRFCQYWTEMKYLRSVAYYSIQKWPLWH